MSKAHWVALTTSARVGGRTITRLLERFGSLEAALEAAPDDLRAISGIGPRTAAAIAAIDLGAVEAELVRFKERGIQVITWEDREHYPANLLRAGDSPPVLFVRGKLSPLDTRAVAVVGTRTPSRGGAELAYQTAHELARRGWTVVSGLAVGIDTAAHRGALDAQGRTLAVLGAGVFNVYPQRNVPLAEEIEEWGAVLAEVHPETTVSPQNLMARNRITSGLSRAVIVTQANDDSGSVSTAHRAWQQGRAVFAVAGGDVGCEGLIRQGAQAIVPGEIDWDALSERLSQA